MKCEPCFAHLNDGRECLFWVFLELYGFLNEGPGIPQQKGGDHYWRNMDGRVENVGQSVVSIYGRDEQNCLRGAGSRAIVRAALECLFPSTT